MNAIWANWVVLGVAAYAVAGVAFAIPFLLKGVTRIDPAARDAPLGFRLLILPATIALWPILLRRWLSGAGHPPEERNAHRQAAAR